YLRDDAASEVLRSHDIKLSKTLLDDSDRDRRYFGLGGLEGRFDPESLSLLKFHALKDKDLGVRERALSILARRADWPAVRALQEIEAKEPEMVARILEKLTHKRLATDA